MARKDQIQFSLEDDRREGRASPIRQIATRFSKICFERGVVRVMSADLHHHSWENFLVYPNALNYGAPYRALQEALTENYGDVAGF